MTRMGQIRMDSQKKKREQGTEKGEDEEKTKEAGGPRAKTHLSKCALSDDLDRPEIPQTDLRPAEPQKLRLRARMFPDLSQLAVLRYTREGSLELCASKQRRAIIIIIAKQKAEREQNARQRHPGRRSQIDVATRARQTAHAPDVQVDRGLERKAVMGLQLDLGCRRTGAGFGREVVRAALIVDVICGLLRRRLRGQRLLWLRNGGNDGDRRGGG